MGTDIHCVVEGRDESGKWVCLNPIRKAFRRKEQYAVLFEEPAMYDFFARLCGVRKDDTDKFEPLVKTYSIPPEDASVETVEAMTNTDYHSHGVCSYLEYVDLADNVYGSEKSYFRCAVEEGIDKVFDFDGAFIEANEQNFRVVFAFDS